MVTTQLADPIAGPIVRTSAETFAAQVIALHERLTFEKLVPSLDGVPIHLRRRHGYTVVAFRHDQTPRRYQIGIMGFRLAQYLKLGWASPEVVHDQGMFWEDVDHASPNDLHIVAMDDATGAIIGYLGAAFIADENDDRKFTAENRPTFPVEEAHGIDISTWLPSSNLRLGDVMEIKRFVKGPNIPDSMKFLVPLELVLGLMGLTVNRSRPIPWAVGDLEMHVALRHLKAFGVDTEVIAGTHSLTAFR